MYIDGDTHYWPLRFIDKVSHPGKGYVEVTPDKGDLIRFGEPVPGKVATYYRDGNKIHSFKEGRWSLAAARRIHEEGRLRYSGLDPR